ncbi:phosphoglycerate mutase, partial [Acidobacteriota bacterium]
EKIRKGIDLGSGVEFDVRTVKEHRAMVLFRAEGLSEAIKDTDPQAVGKKPLKPEALGAEGTQTAALVDKCIEQIGSILSDERNANFVLLRGFAKSRSFESFEERYGLRACAIANYPMYRGVAKLLGMDLHPIVKDVKAQFEALSSLYKDYDFFFFHVKATDSRGEDGDFEGKVKVIEEVDSLLPPAVELEPHVLAVTGDHSTPSVMKSHSWHPVPVLLHGATCRADDVDRFGEQACLRGGLGRMPMVKLMPLILAHAGRLQKFGA